MSSPADARWLVSVALEVNEASLTEESVPVSKQAGPLPVEIELAD